MAENVGLAFHSDKINYELFGIGNNMHMHWHIIHKRNGNIPYPGSIWRMNREEMNDSNYSPDEKIEYLMGKLNAALNEVSQKYHVQI